MKRFLNRWLVVCFGLVLAGQSPFGAAPPKHSGTPARPEVIGRIHSVGQRQLGDAASGRVFQEVWKLPATARLRAETLDRLAVALAANFQPKNKTSPANCSALIRPLLTDLCTAEFFAEVVEHPQDLLESTLALRLDEAQSRTWQANWSQLLAGWTWRTAAGAAQLSVFATNSWFALHCVTAPSDSSAVQLPPNAILTSLRQGRRPVAASQDYWVKLDADLPRWAQWLAHGGHDLPRVALQVAGRKEYVRSEARLTFREPVAPRIEKWDIPIATLHDPLISFTAVQGLASWLKKRPLLQELGLEKTPNQLYLWGLSQTVFQIQAAVPVPDAANAFNQITAKWAPRFNRTVDTYGIGDIHSLTNRAELLWRGLPIVVPHLEPVQQGNHGYLHAGIFPVDPPTNPPPARLLQQLTSQTNLLYYDWEITQSRLNQLRPLLQLVAVFLNVSPMSTNSTPSNWLDALEPRLGNTITEVSVASPRELNVVRTSHIGLNGLELLTLANWLEGTNFPRLDLNFKFRPVFRPTRQKAPRSK